MAPLKGTCKNHPKQQSSRRCFHCKEYICSECQQIHEHHFFCGLSCYYKWKVEPFWNWLKGQKQYAFIFLLIVLSDIFLYMLLKSDPAEPVHTKVAHTLNLPNTAMIRLDTSRTVYNYGIHIRLESVKKKNPILLWKNGKFISSAKVQDGILDFGEHYFSSGKNSFSLWIVDERGQSSLVDSFVVYFSSARIDFLKKQVARFSRAQKNIALTFDGGSSNRTTKQILDTLKSRNLQCTMFLTGNFIRLYPKYVQRMLADGHELGNHSFSHPHLTLLEMDGSSKSKDYVDRRFIQRQLHNTDSLFQKLTGRQMVPLWRAPFGELNRDILQWAAEAGYKHINWSARGDSWDWVADTTSNLYRRAEEIYAHYMDLEANEGLNGRILLMHLGSERASDFPYEMLGKLIDELRKKGYRFSKVSDLIIGQ